MKRKVRGSATLSSAFVVIAFGVVSASAQLNPTVKVLPKPQTSVPPECEQGLAPAVPRVIVAENETAQEKPAHPAPPPSLDLKTQLRSVQVAAERADRDAFKSALADSRAVVSAYPAGGERSAANDVLSVYNDLEKLWDYQFTSPTGAFFDASTDFVSMMRRYPDYTKAIADQTLTTNGQTLYPTDETRRFLVSEAARRLSNLGVRTPTRIAEVPPPPPPAPKPQPKVVPPPMHAPAAKAVEKPAPKKTAAKPAQKHTQKTTAHKTTTHKTTPHKTTPKPPVKVAEAHKPVPAHVPAPTPSPTPTPAPQPKAAQPPPMPKVTPMPSPKPAPAPVPVPASVPAPVPAPRPQPELTETTASLPTDTMSTTTTAAPAAQTTATTATSATTTTAKPAENPPSEGGGKVNLLFAIILIIVGIGVLIILFRASD
jgi:hypothetical protein